jgi:CheY-like chemotaxis protein
LKVTLCGHGQEAVDLLDPDNAAPVDVIITDLEMPMMDGYEFVSWLRDQTRWMDTPVIGLTGHAFSETRTRCLELGMDDFITKPVEADVLYGTLMDALHMKEVPAHQENSHLAQLPNLFVTHCAGLPAKLHGHLIQNDAETFAREIHSMVSLLALLDEQELHSQFRFFEQGLGDGTLKPGDVLNQIHAAWPALVTRYTQQADATTPT